MARLVTLAQLRTDVANLADFQQGSATRYTPALLNRLINQSIQRFRERVSAEGMTHFLVSSSGTLRGPTSPYSFEVLSIASLSPACVRTYGFDVTIQGIVRTLPHRPFTERNDYSDVGPGIPMVWMQYQTATLAITPSGSGFPYTLWYLPVLADLVNDSDTFDGVSGWENWVVWDVICQLAARDNYDEAMKQFTFLRDGIWQDIIRGACRVTAVGTTHAGRDTMRRPLRVPPAAGATLSTGGGGTSDVGMADILMLMGG